MSLNSHVDMFFPKFNYFSSLEVGKLKKATQKDFSKACKQVKKIFYCFCLKAHLVKVKKFYCEKSHHCFEDWNEHIFTNA